METLLHKCSSIHMLGANFKQNESDNLLNYSNFKGDMLFFFKGKIKQQTFKKIP